MPVEQAGKARHAGVHRVALDVNNFRVGQHQGNQAQCQVVGRHLVGDAQGMGCAPRQAQGVVAAPGAQRVGRQLGQVFRKGLKMPRLGVALCHLHQVAQFTGAVHRRVAGNDLLGQRGARARHAQHEHRCRRRVAVAAQAFQKVPVKHRGNAPSASRIVIGVVVQLGAF